MTVKYPTLVNKLATLCNAWLIGSSADTSNDNPRDFDVFVPVYYWSMACGLIDEDAKINTFGGFKCVLRHHLYSSKCNNHISDDWF